MRMFLHLALVTVTVASSVATHVHGHSGVDAREDGSTPSNCSSGGECSAPRPTDDQGVETVRLKWL